MCHGLDQGSSCDVDRPVCVLVLVGASRACLCPSVHGHDSSPEVAHSWWGLGAGYACKPCPVPLSPLLGCDKPSSPACVSALLHLLRRYVGCIGAPVVALGC